MLTEMCMLQDVKYLYVVHTDGAVEILRQQLSPTGSTRMTSSNLDLDDDTGRDLSVTTSQHTAEVMFWYTNNKGST